MRHTLLFLCPYIHCCYTQLNNESYTERGKIISVNHCNKLDVYSQKHLIDDHLLARLDKFQSDSKGDASILLKIKSAQSIIRTFVFAEGTMFALENESNFEVEIAFIHSDINCKPRVIWFQ